jgi:hypothetical protein
VESSPEQTRVQFGRIIRQLKHQWKLGVLLVPLLQLPAATPLGVEPAAAADEPAAAAAAGSEGSRNAEGQLQQQVDAVQGLLAAAAGFGLEDCWQWKPLLDGKQVRRWGCMLSCRLCSQGTAELLCVNNNQSL